MNKWQKIAGIIIISVLIIAHVWALTDYLFVAELAGTYCAEMGQDLFFDCIFNSKIFNANTFAEDLAVDLKTINKNDQY